MDLRSFSFGLVNPDGSVYFLFITDVNKYKNNCEVFGYDIMLQKFAYQYNTHEIGVDTSDSDAADKLARILSDMNIGMTLMKMNPYGTGFQEMKYNNSTGKITEVECRVL